MHKSLKNPPKARLLILTSSFPRGPNDETCGYIRDFARSLASEFEVRVLAPPDCEAVKWPEDAFELARSRSVAPNSINPFQSSLDFNRMPLRSLATKMACAISLLPFIAKAFYLALRADAICSHWMVPSGAIGALISKFLRKPHMVIEHSGALHFLMKIRGGALIARFIAGGADRIIAVSADLKEKLSRLCPGAEDKILVIPMGIHANCKIGSYVRGSNQLISPVDESGRKRDVLFIGRLTEIKGVDVLMKALKESKDVRLIIAGGGELRCELERMARELSIDAIFLGPVDAKVRERLLSSCDAVVVPSLALPDGRTEGMPVVCLEAMAAGRPVIASRAGGLAEMIRDGYNGFLFNPGDHLMLADKLRLLLYDSELWQELSENGRQTAALYDWHRVGMQFGEIIKSLLRTDEPAIHDQRSEARNSGD